MKATMTNKTIVLDKDFPRKTTAIACPKCNGYCDETEITKIEIKQYDCGKGHQCCSKAFKCRLCHLRIVIKLEPPDYY